MPKSRKLALQHKELINAQKSLSNRRSVRLEKLTDYCPGCSELIDVTTAILNTLTYELTFWCNKCAWDIRFLGIVGPD